MYMVAQDNLHTVLKHWEKTKNQEAYRNTFVRMVHTENSADKVPQVHKENSGDMKKSACKERFRDREPTKMTHKEPADKNCM